MKEFGKKIVRSVLGAIGDEMNEKACPIVVYQPRACKRGETLETKKQK